jgi:hypothetical protein
VSELFFPDHVAGPEGGEDPTRGHQLVQQQRVERCARASTRLSISFPARFAQRRQGFAAFAGVDPVS